MLWATRQFGIADWYEIQERFRYQYILMDMPDDMLLIAAKVFGQRTQLYVGVPSRRLLEPYEDFHDVPEALIPKQVALLGGDGSKFRDKFKWPPP